MADIKSIYKEVIKCFFLSFKRLSLYAPDHPLSKEILTSLFKMFDVLLKENTQILIVVGVNADEMVVNNDVLNSEVLGTREIYEKFKAFKLDGVSFLKGLSYDELVNFVKAMAQAATLDAGKPAPLPALLKDGSQHIKIKKIHYEKIEEGQTVVTGEAVGTAGIGTGKAFDIGSGTGTGTGTGIGLGTGTDTFGDIKSFLTGKNTDITASAQAVLEEMDQNVSKVADAIIESARESGDFEAVIKKFVSWVSKYVAPVLVEKKKDPAKFIQKLFDSFQKDELACYPRSEEVVEECADEIKVTMIESVYVSQYAQSPKKAINVAVKILSDEDDQKRLIPKLANRLVAAGASKEETQGFVENVEKELIKDEDVAISKKKLARLMKISERFDDEVSRRVRSATEELSKTNRRLSIEKERSDEVMRHLADGLVVVDKEGKVIMMNPAAEKLLGRETKEAVGRSLVEGLKEEHLLAVAKGPLDDKDETRITKEIEVNSKDDTTKRILRASSAVVENEDGKTVGMVSVLSDITHEKEVEEMKSHFVSLVTHELRTPVVAIQKSLELILSRTTGQINEDQERFLSISKFNLERLNRLINDLLDMSKLEAGKMTLTPMEFDLNEVASEVRVSLVSWAKDKDITLNLDLTKGPIVVNADRDRITQVLVNLVGNALKFTPSKGAVTVILNPVESKEGVCVEPCVEVSVADTGIGIDPKDFKRIFNKFEQISLVSPAGSGGSGLGLPIAKEIVDLHGGTIWVESQKGKGSIFIFVIPRQFKGTKKEKA
ncbi:MAG: PAS domain S-box protein [Candidatus Omnitrophica bacterium]|nr:PAS domain S-box protein [Candidatus Omnitrophota bacterium]